MWPETIYAKSAEFVQRDIAGECILVPLKRTLQESNCIYVLNETGAAFWRQLDGQRTTHAIVQTLLDQYDVQPDQLSSDLTTLIEDLSSICAITAVGAVSCNG
jgi:hypothetical protein